MSTLHRTIVRPIVTERTSAAYQARREYVFEVATDATKPAIRHAILTFSLFRTQNALLIAAVILLTGCVSLGLFSMTGGIAGLIMGGVAGLLLLVLAEALFLYFSFNDEKLHAQAVAELLSPQVNFEPANLTDKELAAKVDQALEYWALIDDTVDKAPGGVLRDRLAEQ